MSCWKMISIISYIQLPSNEWYGEEHINLSGDNLSPYSLSGVGLSLEAQSYLFFPHFLNIRVVSQEQSYKASHYAISKRFSNISNKFCSLSRDSPLFQKHIFPFSKQTLVLQSIITSYTQTSSSGHHQKHFSFISREESNVEKKGPP